METDPDNWPIYHGLIKSDLAEDRLRQDNRIGSFLVRYAGGDYILSYIKEDFTIKHIKLSFAQDTNLRKCHPGINDIRKTASFITGLGMHFLYGVSCADFGDPEENSGFRRDRGTCHICEKPFKDKAELIAHLRTHRISYCEICNDIVPASSFQSHKGKCRAPTKPLLRCDVCHVFETRLKHTLKRHKELKHGDHSVTCNICSKHFGNEKALQNHKTVHTGYPCQTCGKRFKSNYHRKRHIVSVHEEEDDSDANVTDVTAPPDSQSTGPCSFVAESPLPCASTAPSISTSTPSHSSAPPPNFSMDDDLLDPGDPPPDEHHHDQCNSDYEDLLEPGEHESNRHLGLFKCTYCKYKGNRKKKLKRHMKRCHPDGPPPLIQCEFCSEFKTKYPKSLARHMEKTCPGLKNFCILTGDTLWEVLTEIDISNNQAYKMLSLLKKKLGVRFFPKYLRKVLSEKLNSYREYLTVENLHFKDSEGNDCPTSSTLVYVHDLKRALDDAISGRGIVRPHISVGLDGGGKKVIVIIQIYDLEELNEEEDDNNNEDDTGKKKDPMKSLGAKRSIVIARGDFAYESRDNIELIYQKLRLFEVMDNFPNWHQIGDCKVQNTCAGNFLIL